MSPEGKVGTKEAENPEFQVGKRQVELRIWVPLDPSSKPFATLGGRIAGPRVLGVGVGDKIVPPHCPALVFPRGASGRQAAWGARRPLFQPMSRGQ